MEEEGVGGYLLPARILPSSGFLSVVNWNWERGKRDIGGNVLPTRVLLYSVDAILWLSFKSLVREEGVIY